MSKNCPMRHENGNCIPAGGFCTANKNICEALHNAYRMGKAQLFSEGATSDLISRQAAIDAIVQCTNCGDEDTLREYVLKHSLDNGWTGGILEALDAVKDLPTVQPEPHWIPVSERLPEKNGEYLVTTQWLNGDIDVSLYEYSATYKEWNDGDMCGQKVIAWMPLPTPYTK